MSPPTRTKGFRPMSRIAYDMQDHNDILPTQLLTTPELDDVSIELDEDNFLLGYEYNLDEFGEPQYIDYTKPFHISIASNSKYDGEHGFIVGSNGIGKTHTLHKLVAGTHLRKNPHIIAVFGNKDSMGEDWRTLARRLGGRYINFGDGTKKFYIGDLEGEAGLKALQWVVGSDIMTPTSQRALLDMFYRHNKNILSVIDYLIEKVDNPELSEDLWERLFAQRIKNSKYLTTNPEEAFYVTEEEGVVILDFYTIDEADVKDTCIYMVTEQIMDWARVSKERQSFVFVDEYSTLIEGLGSGKDTIQYKATRSKFNEIANQGRQMGISLWAFMQSRKYKGKSATPLDQAMHLFIFQSSTYDKEKFQGMTDHNVSKSDLTEYFKSLVEGQIDMRGRCYYYNTRTGESRPLQIKK